METKLTFRFRWTIKQTGPNTVEMTVPRGNGPSIINPEFAHSEELTGAEVDACEDAVIREIAVVK